MASESRFRVTLATAFLLIGALGAVRSVAEAQAAHGRSWAAAVATPGRASSRASRAIQPGHLYAGPLGGITLFPLDARGLPKSTPDRVIPASATGLAFGPDGNVYAAVNYSAITTDGDAVFLIGNPISKPTVLREFCVKQRGGIAETKDGYTFVAERRGISIFDRMATGCPQRPRGVIRVSGIPALSYPSGLALQQSILYTTDIPRSMGPRILAIPARVGLQRPIAVVSGAQTMLVAPNDVQFGP